MKSRYAPIQKVVDQGDGTIMVWGVASSESVDSEGDVIKASAMKNALPNYMEWGAIREMHQPIAAGTCIEASVDDSTGETLICAHVVDEGSVKKVQSGVLKGFSIGGIALGNDPVQKNVITELDLIEISLVDKPANPDAKISLWKADKMGKETADVTPEQFGDELTALVKAGKITLSSGLAILKKAAEGAGNDGNQSGAGKEPKAKEVPNPMAGQAAPQATAVESGKEARVAKADGIEEEDPGAPVTPLPEPKIGDLVTISWNGSEISGNIGEIKELPDGAKSVIVTNGSALIAVDAKKLLNSEEAGEAVHWVLVEEPSGDYVAAKAAKVERLQNALKKAYRGKNTLQKGFWSVQDWAGILQQLCYLMQDVRWEAVSEQDPDDEDLLVRLGVTINNLGMLMLEYAENQLPEIFDGVCDPDNIPEFIIELACKPGELQKFASKSMGLGFALKKAMASPNSDKEISEILAKVAGDRTEEAVKELKKSYDVQVNTLMERITKLEAQPAQIKGQLRSVDKSATTVLVPETPETTPVLVNGKVDEAATALKKSFANPQTFNRLSTQ